MVEVEIGGQTFRIASPYAADYTARVATYLNEKLGNIQKAAKHPPAQQALILVAFDVIDELFQAEQRAKEERMLLKNGVAGILDRVDTRLAELEKA